MESKYFNHNVIKLQKEINNISYNINKRRYKNHKTLSNLVEKLKNISNAPIAINNENQNANIKIKKNKENKKNKEFNNTDLYNNSNNLEVNKSNQFNNNNKYSNHKKINKIDTIYKTFKSNETNDDDILLTENNIINARVNIVKYIHSECHSNNKNKRNQNLNRIDNFIQKNPSINLFKEKKQKYDKVNKKNISLNPNYFNNNLYKKKIKKDNFQQDKKENSKIRFKFLKNIKDEIEDIKFINNEKEVNHNKENNINNKINQDNESNININTGYISNSHLRKESKNSYFKEKEKENKKYNLSNNLNFQEFNSKNNLTQNIPFKSINNKLNSKIYSEDIEIDDSNKKLELQKNNNYVLFYNKSSRHKKINYLKNINEYFQNLYNNKENINNNLNLLDQEKNNIEIFNNKNKNSEKQTINEEHKKNNIVIQNLLKLKGLNNIEQLISWIKNIKQCKDFVNKIEQIFLIYNEKNQNYNNILFWIQKINNNEQNRKIYENYCKEIMKKNNLKDIKEFKSFMNQNLNINKKNTYILKEMEKLFKYKQINENDYNDNDDNLY